MAEATKRRVETCSAGRAGAHPYRAWRRPRRPWELQATPLQSLQCLTRSALLTNHHGPIITVGQPTTITPPCAVGSPIRAAIRFPIKTVGDPFAMVSGGPTHTHMSVARAAGWPAIRTVGHPSGRMGPPTCGMGGVPGVTIGHVCISPIRAAGGIVCFLQTVSGYERADFCPDFESSATSGLVGFALAGSCGLSGLLPLPEPAEPPLLIITIVP